MQSCNCQTVDESFCLLPFTFETLLFVPKSYMILKTVIFRSVLLILTLWGFPFTKNFTTQVYFIFGFIKIFVMMKSSWEVLAINLCLCGTFPHQKGISIFFFRFYEVRMDILTTPLLVLKQISSATSVIILRVKSSSLQITLHPGIINFRHLKFSHSGDMSLSCLPHTNDVFLCNGRFWLLCTLWN